LWRYIDDLAIILVYVLAGWAFGMHIAGGWSLLAALGALAFGCISVLGLGFLSAAMFSLVNAKAPSGDGEPVAWLVRTLQALVCGVYFPVDVLPNWLRSIGSLMPQTYVLDYVRRMLIPSYPNSGTLWLHRVLPWAPQTANIVAVIALGAVILPLGLAAFNRGLEKARYDGGLSRWN
jgi:ABC-2 type transport system permease protein